MHDLRCMISGLWCVRVAAHAYVLRIAYLPLSGLEKAEVCMISGWRKITLATYEYVLRIAYSAHVISHSWWITLATHAYAWRMAYSANIS